MSVNKKSWRISRFSMGVCLLALAYVVFLAIKSNDAHAATATTRNANVYVRISYDAAGNPDPVALQYAGGDIVWDDCDNCADALELWATKGGNDYFGPAAEGMPGAAYSLKLGHKQVFKRGSYYYRSMTTGRKTKVNAQWSGHGKLLQKKGCSYLAEVFFKYYDPRLEPAPRGITDPTLAPMHVGGTR
jgi:hypothetical protein